MPAVEPGSNTLVPVSVKAAESGKHGAMVISRVTLLFADGTSTVVSSTPQIMREEATATSTPYNGTVNGAPTTTTGTSGKVVINLPVVSSSGLNAGQYIRSTAAGRQGVYQVDTVPNSTNIRVFAAPAEMDILNGDTIERVTGEFWYTASVSVSYDSLLGQSCTLELEVDGLVSSNRGSSLWPYFATGTNERKLESIWPSPFKATVV